MNFTESLVPKKELVGKGQTTLNIAPHGPNWELVGKEFGICVACIHQNRHSPN